MIGVSSWWNANETGWPVNGSKVVVVEDVVVLVVVNGSKVLVELGDVVVDDVVNGSKVLVLVLVVDDVVVEEVVENGSKVLVVEEVPANGSKVLVVLVLVVGCELLTNDGEVVVVVVVVEVVPEVEVEVGATEIGATDMGAAVVVEVDEVEEVGTG